MKFLFYLCGIILTSCSSVAQPDNDQLLKEATTKLQDRSATVSDILIDKKYLHIHPLTTFRELIKTNCTTDILKITTPDEPGKK